MHTTLIERLRDRILQLTACASTVLCFSGAGVASNAAGDRIEPRLQGARRVTLLE
jgi:hypothetical protein